MKEKAGVLLVNLGTPDAPTPAAVRRYLGEFLSDPRVVELPRLLWLPILHGVVLNTRPRKSAAKYASIWTSEGSPLRVHTERQAKLLRGYLGKGEVPAVDWAMRYGSRRIAEGLDALAAAGVLRVLVVPLYPQYARSTTASVHDAVARYRKPSGMAIRVLESFHDDPGYIRALAAALLRQREKFGFMDRLLLSFHGLPQRSVDRGDPYRDQCEATARLLAREANLKDGEWQISFQSRFGAAEWLRPYTSEVLEGWAREGVRRADVLCPGFVSDCLETLEEIGIEARHAFLAAGGAEFHLVPCLNEDPGWIAALKDICLSQLEKQFAHGA